MFRPFDFSIWFSKTCGSWSYPTTVTSGDLFKCWNNSEPIKPPAPIIPTDLLGAPAIGLRVKRRLMMRRQKKRERICPAGCLVCVCFVARVVAGRIERRTVLQDFAPANTKPIYPPPSSHSIKHQTSRSNGHGWIILEHLVCTVPCGQCFNITFNGMVQCGISLYNIEECCNPINWSISTVNCPCWHVRALSHHNELHQGHHF